MDGCNKVLLWECDSDEWVGRGVGSRRTWLTFMMGRGNIAYIIISVEVL
jgi:hypothetical protein